MKKLIVFALLAMATFSSLEARADNASVGTVAGVIGGAAVGHAVGHDSQGTLLGAAVGGVFGYIIGNEMDRGSNVHYVYPDNRRPVYVVEPPYRRPETVVVVDRYIPARPYPLYRNVVFVPEQRYYPGHHGYHKHHKQGKHSRWDR
ncbi:MAG: glycine zipper domain-containing protein [Pseudomonadota bacterium]